MRRHTVDRRTLLITLLGNVAAATAVGAITPLQRVIGEAAITPGTLSHGELEPMMLRRAADRRHAARRRKIRRDGRPRLGAVRDGTVKV
jgi:hypothetical protein